MQEREHSKRVVTFVVQEVNQSQAGDSEVDGMKNWKLPSFKWRRNMLTMVFKETWTVEARRFGRLETG